MSLRIAAIADTHYASGALEQCGARRCAIADILLLRTVHRLNRFVKPDLTVLLGDLVDDASREGHEHIRAIIDKLQSPSIVLPGNHDGNLDAFYTVYDRPADCIDINGARVLTFIDPEQTDYNARRTDSDIARMDRARAGHDGPIVSLQHVPLFKPGASASPYGYTNAADIWSAFERNHFTAALSGHWHAGETAGNAIIVPALCEAPFRFLEITIDGDRVETIEHQLSLPRDLRLIDYHCHTQFAYCSDNMNMATALALAGEYGLGGLSLTEHSGQLYFDRDTFWGAAFLQEGIDTTQGRADRMADFLSQVREFSPPAFTGLEIDCDNSGRPVVRREDWDRAHVRVGAIHWLQELRKPEPDYPAAAEEMLGRLATFLTCGVQILAHPLRLFRKHPELVPPSFVPRLIDLLRKHNVAAEINFHNQITTPEFVRSCVESGVKLAFGSDAHNLYEVAEFYPHLELMRASGIAPSDIPGVLADTCHAELDSLGTTVDSVGSHDSSLGTTVDSAGSSSASIR